VTEDNDGIDIRFGTQSENYSNPDFVKPAHKKLEYQNKLKSYGFWLIVFIVVVVLTMFLVDLSPNNSVTEFQEDVFDFLKSLCMVAIGYVFSRSNVFGAD
jgi:hypothetical protein